MTTLAQDAFAAQQQHQVLGRRRESFEANLALAAGTAVPAPCERFEVVDGAIQVTMLGLAISAKARPIIDSRGGFSRLEYPFVVRDGDVERVILRVYLSDHRDLHLDPNEAVALCNATEHTRAYIIAVALSDKLRSSGLFKPLGDDGRVTW